MDQLTTEQTLEEQRQDKKDSATIEYIKTRTPRKIQRAFFSEIRRGATPSEALRQIRARR